METRSIRVRKTARYHLLGEVDSWSELWLCLHGYAQDASRFLAEFAPLQGAGRLLVAPEGLSRFYQRGSSGRVGASWMTSVEREAEIDDYVAYLEALLTELGVDPGAGRDGARTNNLVGFSQGAHTAARFAVRARRPPERLVLWGGDFPADLDPAQARRALGSTRVQVVIGDSDQYLPAEKVQAIAADLESLRIDAELRRFEGGHHLSAGVLADLLGPAPGA